MMLLDYQQNNFSVLENALKSYDHISIVGKANSGRTEVVSRLQNSNYIIINILPISDKKYKYEDFLFAVKELKEFKKINQSFTLDISLTYNFVGMSLGRKSNDLYALENELLKRLRRLSHRKKIIIVIKDIDHVDIGTQEILSRLFKTKHRFISLKRIKCIDICETKNKAKGHIIYFDSLSTEKEHLVSALKVLNLNPKIKLSDYILDFIQKNADGNIGIISKIVDDINNENIDIEFNSRDNNFNIQKLIYSSIDVSDYKDKILDILSIISICDKYFNGLDLSFLIEEELNIVEIYLQYAVDHKLIVNDKEKNGYFIFLGIIKKIFSSLSIDKKLMIYNKVIQLISAFYPDCYHEKYIFAKLANHHNCSTYLLQHIMKQIRETGIYDIENYNNELSEKENNIAKAYYNAYCKSCNDSFNQAIQIINDAIIEYELSSPIKQEFQLLMSQCLIKSIDSMDRKKAIDLLCYDKNDNIIDEYLKYRLETRKIATYIHIGDYKNARQQSDNTINRLMENIKTTKSPSSELYLNNIYRKYCNIHSYDESSLAAIKKSVAFFSKSNQYARAKYIALTNAFALELILGKMSDAKLTLIEIENLKEKYFYIRFPRPEIFENNKLLFSLLSNHLKVDDNILMNYENLYKSTQSADQYLLLSNYAIVLSLSGNIQKAVELLSEIQKDLNQNSDLEGIYSYRIISNLAILKYIEKNSNKQSSLEMLSTIRLSDDDIHNIERSKEHKLIKETLKNIESCTSVMEWIKVYQHNVDTPKNYFCLYEYGLVFTALFDWDDD